MPVITMSREAGSGEILIAQELAKRLSLKVINKEIISKVAKMAKCSPAQIEKFDQEHFDRMNVFFSDLSFPILGSEMIYPFTGTGAGGYWIQGRQADSGNVDETKYLELTQRFIEDQADNGNVIIIGRGGCVLLKNREDALHLRIVAPFEQRVHRFMETSKQDETTAKQILTTMDKASTHYMKHFYSANWADPLLYHLVINTGMVSHDEAVELIMAELDLMATKV